MSLILGNARLTELGDEAAALVAAVRRSVAVVRSGGGVSRDGRRRGFAGAGSGIVWAADGLIVTNHHVVARDDAAEVELADGRTLPARVIARDPGRDLAALRIGAGGLPAVALGNSRSLRVGQLAIAVGTPWGVPGVVTAGIVSGWGESGGRELISAHLDLQPGNSGGPLVDAAGRVIGVNAMVAGPRFALAVPSHAVEAFLRAGGPRD